MKINKIILGYLMGMFMVACSSSDDDLKTDGEKGQLDLSVLVDSRVNSVVSNPGSRAVTADSFPIEIEGENGTMTFASYEDLLEEGAPKPITLTVGKYTIKAHTKGEIQKQMDEPYYYGEKDFTITKGVLTTVDVLCKMKNTRIQLAYDSEFTSTFDDWTITITDGTDNILVYTNEDGAETQTKYLLIADNVTKIRISIQATTKSGAKVSETRDVYKPEDSSSNYWEGNDALNIKMEPGEDTEDPYGIKGIDIKVDATFVEEEDLVEVEITPEVPDGPDEEDDDDTGDETGGGDEEKPTISGACLDAPVTYDSESGTFSQKIEVLIAAKAGIENLIVKAETDNSVFGDALDNFGLIEGVDLADNPGEDLSILLTLPEKGTDKYSFSLGDLESLLVNFPGNHKFIITVVDGNGEDETKTLEIRI